MARRSEPSITEESGADDREAMLHRWSTRERAEHAAWNRVMHNDPAGGVVRGAKTKMSVHMKNDKKETHDARKLKRFSSIIHVRVVHHLADHTERAVLLECVDGVYLTQLTKMVQEALKQPKVRLLWLTAEGETIVLDSQRVFDQFAGEEWCVQPWVLHVHEDSPKATHALALHDASRALFERCAISARNSARNSAQFSEALCPVPGTTPTPTARSTAKSSAVCSKSSTKISCRCRRRSLSATSRASLPR